VAAVVVAVVVVLAVLVLVEEGNSGGTPSVPLGTAASYSQAWPSAAAEAQAADQGPWTVVAAEGVGLASGISEPDLAEFGGSGCTYTPAQGSPSTLTLLGTPSNATAGTVAAWVFFAKNAGDSAILLIEVSDGTAVPLVVATGSSCVSTFGSLGSIDSTSEVDSTTIAGELGTNGGQTFLAAHAGATQLFVLLGESPATGGAPFWYVTYTTCAFGVASGTGASLTAGYYAASGAQLAPPTSSTSENCSDV
jgi:hypothetical protein